MLLDVSVTHVYKVVITSSILAAKPLADAPLFNRNPTNRRQKTSPNNRPPLPTSGPRYSASLARMKRKRKKRNPKQSRPTLQNQHPAHQKWCGRRSSCGRRKKNSLPPRRSHRWNSHRKRGKRKRNHRRPRRRRRKRPPRTRRNERRAKKNSVCFTFFSKRPKEIDRHGLCFVVRFSFNTKHIIIVYILFLCCVV